MKTKSTLKISGKTYAIRSEAIKRSSVEDYQLDIDNFYIKFGGKPPCGEGYEIEVLNPEEINDWHEKEHKLICENKLIQLHMHTGKDGKTYVCYPLQIKEKEEALRLQKEWARIMFVQIFFGLGDLFLFEATSGKGDTTSWSNFVDIFLKEKGLCVEDF